MSMCNCEGKLDVLELVKYFRNELVGLIDNNKMYLWRTEDTMEMLKKDRDKLEYMMKGVAFTMEDALHKGWWQLKSETQSWLSYGLDAIENADKVKSMFKDASTTDNLVTSILLCPCETMSLRMINARAIRRLYNINEHIREEGKIYGKDIKYKDIALKRETSDSQIMDAQAIGSFCAAQRGRKLRKRIQALLDLPGSLSHNWVEEEESEKLTEGVQVVVPKEGSGCRVRPIQDILCSGKSSQVEEASVVKEIHHHCCIISSEAEETRSHLPQIESQCSESLDANKENNIASNVQDIQHLEQSENSTVKIPIVVPIAAPKMEPARFQAEEANEFEMIQLSHFVKYSTFPRSQCYDSVPVLIRAKAPRYTGQPRAPIDLVMVLAICGSVDNEKKLQQLKQGCKFVVHNLEATDRLSIVACSNDGEPNICLSLTYMTDDAKRWTNQLIASLQPRGGADFVTEAMKLADKALRGQCIPGDDRVGSIMLLSDGKLTTGDGEDSARAENYCITNTLGLGLSHDPCSLYASVTKGHGHGTYSFVADSYENIREAMAMYIGGLTSITARDAEICIRSAHPAVRISGIACGAYDCIVEDDGKSRRISVNNLYASEEKSFIVFVDVPAEEAGGSIFTGTPKTKLLSVTASYCCPVTRARVGTDVPMEISVERPRWGRTHDGNISVEVTSEVLRTKVFNGVNEIWSQGIQTTTAAAAKDVTGKLAGLRKDIEGTNEAKAAKDVWLDLCEDLDHMQEGGSSDEEKLYVETAGLPYMLSWLSSHRSQRAATPGSASKNRSLNFRTTRMQNMIDSVDTAPSAYIE